MKKYEILFNWPIEEIARLSDSDVAEAYAEQLSAVEQELFVSLTEAMRGNAEDLKSARENRENFAGWGRLGELLSTFSDKFPSFPGNTIKKFRLFAFLASKISQSETLLDEAEINHSLFEIRNLSKPLPQSWFSKENAANFENSVIVFQAENLSRVAQEFDVANISTALMFQILAALALLPELSEGHKAMIKKGIVPIEDASVEAFVRLVLLMSGKTVHAPRHYSTQPFVLDIDTANPEHPYQQWNEIFSVLSEYNSRKEILLKYLTIYHVVENLMFKLPIVELERQQAGRMFSIRDFRRLYSQVENAELAALKKLCSEIFKIRHVGGHTFEHGLILRWRSLSPTTPIAEIEASLNVLNIKKKHADFKAGSESAAFFAQLVYTIRCAIVHNKETEFHLTYASLSRGFTALIENFLLPSLEEICFSLLGAPNSKVWYTNKELALY